MKRVYTSKNRVNKIVALMDFAKFQGEINKIYTFNYTKKKHILIAHAL
jgi:hypothetical protein